jgi:hypothetical protein
MQGRENLIDYCGREAVPIGAPFSMYDLPLQRRIPLKLSRYYALLVLLALVGAVALAGCGGQPAAALPTPTQAAAAVDPTSTPEPELAPTTAAEPDGWVTYTPEDGTFSVQFPGKPEEVTTPTDTAAGQITLHSLSYTGNGPEYNLSYNDLPDAMAGMDPETAATVLEGSIKGASQGSEILGQQTVQVGGYPGVRGEIDMAENHAWYMSVITPRRQYQLVMVTSDQGKDTFGADAQRFLDSFTITGD